MGTIVERVISWLRGAGIRADEAYPGGRIPALSGAVAAVRLGKVDRAVRTTTVEIVIMSPAAAGGNLCERTALRAVEAIQAMDGTCVKDVCRFDEMADVFYIEIKVEFFGTALELQWSAGPGYSIKIGQQPMPNVVSFISQRKVSEDTVSLGAAKWEFTMEELLPPGSTEPPDPAEPFVLTVVRGQTDETFSGCVLTSVKREDTIRGVSQIRTGTAQSRAFAAIL